MIYVFNETNLELALGVKQTSDEKTFISLKTTDESITNSIDLLEVRGKDLIEAVNNRYADGVVLAKNPSKDYVMIPDHCILMDTDEDALTDLGSVSKEDRKQLDEKYVNNMLVLVLSKGSKYFVRSRHLAKRASYHNWLDNVVVITMFIKANYWGSVKDTMTVLIQSSLGDEDHKIITMTAKDMRFSKTAKHHKHNVLLVDTYTGEFPEFKKHNNNSGDYKPRNNYNGNKKSNYNNNRNNGNFRGDYDKRYYDDDANYNTKKNNGHGKKQNQRTPYTRRG